MGAAEATRTSPAPPAPLTPRSINSGEGRFLPGTMLAGRYRMVGLLGRGGMGEVYRADDLKLGQPVALKFLPRDVERDPERLERFLTEVRLSLRVTHPNVCRVFDIAQADGRHFLSMEYVDGEDLASLLRRIGRLPEDKAIEIARQLCAGLAAAHEEGVLHRDLKPANVMLDGRGRAKITDFGLAGATAGISGAEARAGTPQYMAPEQASGGALTEQTDLYALGLVLYELFTGKRAYQIASVDDLQKLHSSTPTTPSAHVSGLSPAVERAILRCLQPDPANRPASASALAASLPGGDPLAMAIAAGETPSPEMVAQAGGTGALRPATAALCLAVLLVGLGGIWFVQGRTSLTNRVAMPTPPAELAVAARAVIAAAGHASRPAGAVHGFERDGNYFTKVTKEDQSPGRWDGLELVNPPPIWFWYREGPAPLAPMNMVGNVGPGDPPLLAAGMIRVRLDPSGRLQQFRAVPPDLPATSDPSGEPDWNLMFDAAGLTLSNFAPADPLWAIAEASDVRRAWTSGDLRVEAAAFRGRVVRFLVVPPWRRANDGTPPERDFGAVVGHVLSAIVIVAAALLARRNLRSGKSDRRGALRVAVVYTALGATADLLLLSGGATQWFPLFTRNLALQLYFGALVWIFYVALEPYVRRLWPGTLIAWTRALEGRLRDPLVGRHILLGGLAGLVFTLNFMLPMVAANWLGLAPPEPEMGGLAALASTRHTLANYFLVVQESFFIPVAVLLGLLLLRVLLKRPWLAYAAGLAIVMIVALSAQLPPVFIVSQQILMALTILLLTRLGLLAFLVGIVFSYWGAIPLTTNPESWFFGASVMSMLLCAGIAVYGFVVSLGGQKVLDFDVKVAEA